MTARQEKGADPRFLPTLRVFIAQGMAAPGWGADMADGGGGHGGAKCRASCVGLSCRHPTDEDHPAMAAPKPQGRARKVTQRRSALDPAPGAFSRDDPQNAKDELRKLCRSALDPAPGAFSRDDPQNAKDELRKLYGKPRGEKP